MTDGQTPESENTNEGFSGIPSIVKPDLENVRKLTESMDYKIALLTRDLGLSSGIQARTIEGVIYGSLFAIVLVGIPIILKYLL